MGCGVGAPVASLCKHRGFTYGRHTSPRVVVLTLSACHLLHQPRTDEGFPRDLDPSLSPLSLLKTGAHTAPSGLATGTR
jgi:hypothetical protein